VLLLAAGAVDAASVELEDDEGLVVVTGVVVVAAAGVVTAAFVAFVAEPFVCRPITPAITAAVAAEIAATPRVTRRTYRAPSERAFPFRLSVSMGT